MADQTKDEKTTGKPTVENRWWAEVGKGKEAPAPKRDAIAGAKFFEIAAGYDQDRARDNLTDNNLRLLLKANPEEGKWGRVQMLETTFPQRDLERIQRAVDLPPYARGAVIDCGQTIRLLVTGTPVGERILELALVETPSFDCWVKHDWVCEELYRNRNEALARFREHVRNFLSPEAIAAFEANLAQA